MHDIIFFFFPESFDRFYFCTFQFLRLTDRNNQELEQKSLVAQ